MATLNSRMKRFLGMGKKKGKKGKRRSRAKSKTKRKRSKKKGKRRRRSQSRRRSRSRYRSQSRRRSDRRASERRMLYEAHNYLSKMIRKNPELTAYSLYTIATIILAVIVVKQYGMPQFNNLMASAGKALGGAGGSIGDLFGQAPGALKKLFSSLTGALGFGAKAAAAAN